MDAEGYFARKLYLSTVSPEKRPSPGSAIIHRFSQKGQVKLKLVSGTLGLACVCYRQESPSFIMAKAWAPQCVL
jgi:hypothetical protein